MRADLLNSLALLACLVCGVWAAMLLVPQEDAGWVSVAAVVGDTTAVERITDARGVSVPVGAYQRIVSLNPVADHLLLQLVGPDRLVGITAHTAEDHPDSWRFGDRARVGTSRDIEPVLGLRPDLVIASQFSEEAYMARLREAGIVVFDLGDTRDAHTTAANIKALGTLLEERVRAARLLGSYRRELAALAQVASTRDRLPGVYLTNVGGVWFGGTSGSSYGDLLRLAGVEDLAAASGYRDWPQFSREQILSLAPPLVITRAGGREALCGDSVLRQVPACRRPGQIIEMPPAYDSDPGLGLVQAAAILQTLLSDVDSTDPTR